MDNINLIILFYVVAFCMQVGIEFEQGSIGIASIVRILASPITLLVYIGRLIGKQLK